VAVVRIELTTSVLMYIEDFAPLKFHKSININF